jgi:hypothetical protein
VTPDVSVRKVGYACSLLAGLVLFLGAYCMAPQKLPPPDPTSTPTLQVIVITATSLAVTASPIQPTRTATPRPTENILRPTATPAPPTATPEPTDTPVPPTETPERTPVQRG